MYRNDAASNICSQCHWLGVLDFVTLQLFHLPTHHRCLEGELTSPAQSPLICSSDTELTTFEPVINHTCSDLLDMTLDMDLESHNLKAPLIRGMVFFSSAQGRQAHPHFAISSEGSSGGPVIIWPALASSLKNSACMRRTRYSSIFL